MTDTAALERLSAEAVAQLVKDGSKASFAVVDVRKEEEFAAGHVKGAINLDSTAFSDTKLVDELVEQLQPHSQVVLHCAKSQQRGPAAAAALKQRLLELGIDKEVLVMDGGFNRYGELYAQDDSLVTRTTTSPPGEPQEQH